MLSRLSVRQRLAALTVVPLVLLTLAASWQWSERAEEVAAAEAALTRTDGALAISRLVAVVQDERSSAVGATATMADVAAARTETDEAIAAVRRLGMGADVAEAVTAAEVAVADARVALGDDPAKIQSRLARELSTTTPATSALDALDAYGSIIDELLAVHSPDPSWAGSAQLSAALEAVRTLARLDEATTLETLTTIQAGLVGGFDSPRLITASTRWQAERATWEKAFRTTAPPALVASYDEAMSTRSAQVASEARQAALDLFGNPEATLAVPAFTGATIGTANSIDRIGGEAVALAETTAAEQQDAARREQLVLAGVAGVAALVLVALMLVVARSISRPLQALTTASLAVAGDELPATVQRILAGDPHSEGTDVEPGAAGGTASTALARVRGGAEIGALRDAFDDVRATAVALAGEQAASRRSVSELFVHLGRRNQKLLGRQLAYITELERSEHDPDRLHDLYQLDHLATRMRRNAESLLVLAGTVPSRQWREPIAVADVLRAAVAEVEDFHRVEIRVVDDARIDGTAVTDLTHLVAELVENGLHFSSPGTVVQVVARPTRTSYLVSIIDEGVGMTDDELVVANERIADLPDLMAGQTRFLGLFVVGRLAHRHGIAVTLHHGVTGGVAAKIDLPWSVLDRGQPSTAPVDTPVLDAVQASADHAQHGRPQLMDSVAEAPIEIEIEIEAEVETHVDVDVEVEVELPGDQPINASGGRPAGPADAHPPVGLPRRMRGASLDELDDEVVRGSVTPARPADEPPAQVETGHATEAATSAREPAIAGAAAARLAAAGFQLGSRRAVATSASPDQGEVLP